ncbi:phage tail protein [Clostridium gasigenes]|uniref:phage tail protein n=1 Tax=Clostridium gasigenes TaxID=94869 RepID=UPI001C0E1CF2|nr:hypothetical protein [Clostridium gasigenes]MBU3109338.1 hypothetical protein [Clostridium gasigenes]
MTEGSIVINTRIDSSGAEEGLAGLSSKLLSLSNSGLKLFTGAIVGAGKAVAGLVLEAAKADKDFSDKLTILGSGMEGLGTQIYNKFEGPLKTAVQIAIDMFGELSENLSSGNLGDSVDKISEGFGNLMEKVAELVKEWLPKIIDGFAWFIDNGEGIAIIIGSIIEAIYAFKIGAIIGGVIKSWQEAELAMALYKMTSEGATIEQGVMNGVFTVWETLVALFTGEITLATAATSLWAKAQAVLNGIMEANPIGLILVGIVVLVAAVIYLWNTNEGFRTAIISAWDAILASAQLVWGWLVTFFTVDIPNAWNSLMAWISGIPQFFVDLWIGISQVFINGWNAIVVFFTETIPLWIQQIFAWFNELPEKIGYCLGFVLATMILWGVNTYNYILTNIPIWIASIVTFFSELPGKIWTWLVQTISVVASWVCQMTMNAVQAGSNFIGSIINFMAQLPGTLWGLFLSAIQMAINFGINLRTEAIAMGSGFVNNLINVVSSLPDKFIDIGVNIVKGVWNGITSMAGWIGDKVSGFFGGMLKGAKDANRIESPSKLYRDEVGKYMAQGVGVGFEDETENIKSGMSNSLSNLTSKMQATVDFETSKNTSGIVAITGYKTSKDTTDDISTDIPEGSIFIVKNYMDSDEISEFTYKKVNGQLALDGKRVR